MSLISRLFGEGPPESKRYKLALLDETGAIVKEKTYRVYQDQHVNECQAAMLGKELARDAMAHAGWWKARV